MARIKIDLPATFPFSTQIPVRIQDVNYGGHVGNDAILSILHEVRIQFLASIGYKELDTTTGEGFIMSDVAIAYKGEAFHGDKFDVAVAAGDFSGFGFDFFYKITALRNEQTIVIAEAKTGMLCFDYNQHKIARLSAEMKQRLETGKIEA
ncbi:thioesterase [Chitinophaga silvatica]|uniref:Thioesterase n=1 Tax=Chitinophaga silvatica TaxID=2282649 RepID=A0A3E1Y8A3_9BACT|nr:thioesterase family protein [Chitinophaga silvatica]RFS21442.1 thioesterase [Chitinophaga silvatica]